MTLCGGSPITTIFWVPVYWIFIYWIIMTAVCYVETNPWLFVPKLVLSFKFKNPNHKYVINDPNSQLQRNSSGMNHISDIIWLPVETPAHYLYSLATKLWLSLHCDGMKRSRRFVFKEVYLLYISFKHLLQPAVMWQTVNQTNHYLLFIHGRKTIQSTRAYLNKV